MATILAFGANPVRAQSAHPQDSLALVAFYHAAGGEDWKDRTGWLREPVRDWYGVGLNEEERVVRLAFESNNLTGHISSQLGRLTALEDLALSGSYSSNGLTGPIPASLGKLSRLQSLWLDRNELTGEIPPELGSLTNLEELNLSHNALTGVIPASLKSLTKLRDIELRDNRLTGPIPEALSSLTELQDLDLSFNDFGGSIPASLGRLKKLWHLDLAYNRLTGPIPEALGSLTELRYLALAFNDFGGSIPASLGRLTNLHRLGLTFNGLTGTIPDSLGELPDLYALWLGGNALTGSIPPLRNLTNLGRLSLFDNPLDPYDFPMWIMDLRNLWALSLDGTRLRGAIPAELGDMPRLEFLHLERNNLEGALPYNIANAKALTHLYLHHNNLDALDDLCGLRELEEVNIAFNRLTFEDFEDLEDLAECDDPVIVFNSSQEPDREHLAALFERTGFVTEEDGPHEAVRVTARRRPDLEALRQYIDILDALEREGKSDMIPEGHLRVLPRIYRRLAERAERFSESEAGQASANRSDFTYAPQHSVPLRVTREASAVTFSVDVGGKANEYQWYKGNGMSHVAIAGATSHTLRVPLSEPRAVYYCKITNPGVPDLTLYSKQASSHTPEHIAAVHGADSLALVAFYHATGGSGWTNDRDWLKGPLGSWYGVTLNEAGRVTELSLERNNLTGFLPGELEALSALEELDLERNKISGRFPEFLVKLTSLTNLNFQYNALRGFIPTSLGNLIRLKNLNLGSNRLQGPIPETLGNLTSLESFDFGLNELKGSVPASLGNLTRLSGISLHNNHLTGPIPEELGNLSSLEYLFLGSNDITGPIPEELGNLASLRQLGLNRNNLTCSIPASLGRLTNLRYLDLSLNALEGAVPDSILAMKKLESISIHSNRFTSLPDFTGMSNLRWVDVRSNRLTFKDVEQQEHFGARGFAYAPQAAVPVHATRSASHVTFSVEVGGTENKYQWRREGLQGEEAIPGATADTLAVPLSEPPTYYWCEITNPKAPELTLYSERAYPEEIYTSAERGEDVLTFAVHANYPNPFSEATEIAFEAPEATHVRITVYDMLGRRVETAYDRMVSPGRYRVEYSAGDLAPGTYFYHVEMGRFRETRAMMLVR